MDHIYRTHKEPAWGWIGALLDARRLSRRETGEVRLRARPCPAPRVGRPADGRRSAGRDPKRATSATRRRARFPSAS
ncbi:hypothetical protein GCM10009434_19870 [Brevundimonas olei]